MPSRGATSAATGALRRASSGRVHLAATDATGVTRQEVHLRSLLLSVPDDELSAALGNLADVLEILWEWKQEAAGLDASDLPV